MMMRPSACSTNSLNLNFLFSSIVSSSQPRKCFNAYVVENILTRSIYLYNNQLTFDYFYEQIKKLFSKSDYIFGYSVINDIIGINLCEK
mgnify:CR=1 FL=1